MRFLFAAIPKLILFLILGQLTPSCHSPQQDNRHIFRYNQIGGLESLDPAFAKNLAIMWGVNFIYNTLLEVDSNLHIVPSLARNWEVSPDGLRYTFHLRNDVYFQNNAAFPEGKGRKMTAADVVYTFERLINPATASAGAWVFHDRVRDMQPFEAPDDTTFILHLKTPFRPLKEILTMPYCSIVPHEVVEKWGKDFRNHPCGTGPFQFQYWDEGNTLVLYKNDHYWEKDEKDIPLPYLYGVQVSFHETRAIEFLLFQQEKLDFINGIDGSMKDIILTKKGVLKDALQKKFNLRKSVYLNTEYLGILVDTNNALLQNNPLKQVQIRQAINYAIDRQKIVTYFRNGVGVPANRGFIPIGMPGTENKLPYGYQYDPGKAMQLLADAGFPNGKGLPVITLLSPETQADICNFIASELKNIGISVQIQVMQPGLLRQMMSRSQAPFFKAQWIADYPDAETYLAFFYSRLPAPPNYTRFNYPLFDRWYEASLQAENDSMRFQLYAKMDSLVSSQAPVVPLFYDEMLHFTRKNITGLQSNALNMIDLRRVKKQ